MEPKILTNRLGVLELVALFKWFDLKELTFDKDNGEVCIYLGNPEEGPYNEKLLRITDVSHVKIHDEAQGQACELCDVQISASSVRLVLGAPLEIVLTVGKESEIYLLDTRFNGQQFGAWVDSLLTRVRNWFKE